MSWPRKVLPPDITLDEHNRFDLSCPKCGMARPLVWGGMGELELARKRQCSFCYGNSTMPPQPDQILVDLMVAGGYKLHAVKAERLLALARLQRLHPDWQAWKMADHLNVTVRTVERYRAELRAERRAA